MNLFELIYPRFYFNKSKSIRMFEAFSGVGCQAMAIKRITDNYELVGFSEIDVHAIKSYQAIHGEVKNYGDITKMATIPECDIFTWSFPCTDLSKAGKQKGLSGGTRSGLVYEVLRLLHATDIKPKVLIMENVIDLVQVNFVEAFNEIQRELEELGYTNYNEVLNAKDFEIPQNRERVFMVSILKDEENEHYACDFPIKRPLKIRLKDVLEENVDEKYYLSAKTLKKLTDKSMVKTWNDDTKAYKTKEADMPRDRIYTEESIGFTITTDESQMPHIAIKEATAKGYAEATDGGQGTMISGLKSKNKRLKSLVENTEFQEGDTKNLDLYNQKGSDLSQTLTQPNHNSQAIYHNLRIRKLTPLECWRLMGISDEDFYKAKNAGISNSQLYKQAGNGIVVNVFEAILREMIR